MEPDFPATPFTEALLKENEELRTENALLRERCSELEERVNKNSQNSSKPPSSDGYQKPSKKGSDKGDTSSKEAPCSSQETPNPKSLRPSSGNKPGGQKGHQGSCLRRVALPDYVRHLKVENVAVASLRLSILNPPNTLSDRFLIQVDPENLKLPRTGQTLKYVLVVNGTPLSFPKE